MKEPRTPAETLALHKILRSDPQRYLRIVNEWIEDNPENPHAYFDRHFAWMKIGEPLRALGDLNKVIELKPDMVSFMSRGEVYRHLGEYGKALEDFDRGEAIDPIEWHGTAFGPFYQADTYARLGNEFRRPRLLRATTGRLSDTRDLWRTRRRQGGDCRRVAPHRGGSQAQADVIARGLRSQQRP